VRVRQLNHRIVSSAVDSEHGVVIDPCGGPRRVRTQLVREASAEEPSAALFGGGLRLCGGLGGDGLLVVRTVSLGVHEQTVCVVELSDL
jgi:hypothetical protein